MLGCEGLGGGGGNLGSKECSFESNILQTAHLAAEVVADKQRQAAHVVELGQAERELRLVRHRRRHVDGVSGDSGLRAFEINIAVDVELDGARGLVGVAAVYDDSLDAHSAHERDVQDKLHETSRATLAAIQYLYIV